MGGTSGKPKNTAREIKQLRAENESLRVQLAEAKRTLAAPPSRGGPTQDSRIIQLNEELEQRVTQRTAELQTANLELAGEVAERKRQAAAAEQQRQLLAVTLASIGDAVIVTDAQGRVSFLNAEAERLTGWRGAEAQGQPLPTVFRIINEETRQTVENPVDKVLRLGTVVGLANHTVLIARDGHETPIDDSAALIRQRDGAAQGVVLVFRDFSEQKAAEKALRESEERFRTMADAMPQLAWTAQPDGFIHWYNRRWYEYTGTTPQRMEGWGWQSVHDPDVLPAVLERWKASIATGEPFEMEFPLRGADGTFRRFLTRGMPLKDAGGRVMQWLGTNTDVEELARAQQALRENEERLTFVLGGIHAGGWDLDLVDHTAHRSLTHDRIFGYDTLLPQWTYEMFLEHVVPEDRELVDREFRQAVAARHDWNFECRIVRRDKVVRWIWASGQCRGDAGGKPRRLVGLVQDITERKRAEEALRKRAEDALRLSEQEFHSLAEAMPQIVWATTPDGLNIYFNQQWMDYTGMTLEESYGHGWNKPFHPEDQQHAWEAWQRATQHNERYSLEARLRRADGVYRWWLVRGEPMRGAGGEILKWFGTCTDIEELKRNEAALKEANDLLEQRVAQRTAALQESEQHFRTLADAIPNLAWWANGDGYLTWYNRRWYEYTGTTPQQMEGWGWQSVHDPQVLAAVLEQWKAAIASGEPFEMTFPLRGADGQFRRFLTRAQPLKDAHGRVARWFGTNTDVEELARVQESLRDSEERFRALAENVPDLITRFDKDLRLLYANPAVYRRTGLSAEALVGRTAREYGAAPAASEQWERVARQVLAPGEPRRLEAVNQWQGQTRVYDTQLIPERDADGTVRAVIACARDITERKQAEEALRTSEGLYRAIGESIDYGIWVCDAQGRNTYASPSFLKLVGITQQQCSDLGWADLLHPDDVQATIAAWKQCVQTGGPWYREHRYRGADGQWHPILACGVAVRNERGEVTAWAGINLDIRQLKRAEEALNAAKVSAEQAKVAAETASKAKDHFLAVLSHELRTPLAPVVATLAMMHQDPRFDAATRDNLEMIRRNVELEARLIDDLLDVTRIERGKVELDRQPVELCTILRRAAEVCLPDIQARKLEFGIDVPDGPYVVDADPARLQQVFWNLIKNAIKFTPHGGCVGIRCRRDGDRHVIAQVNDSGEGIDPELLPRLFNAFEQGDRRVTRQFGGLGLGLAISKAITEMHGGTLTAHSEGKGRGATFAVRLPLASAELKVLSAAAKATQHSALSTQHSPLRILLVEDHGDTARVMRMLLTADGHEVDVAGDVAAALKLAAEKTFDLLLSDLGLPDGSGLDLMRALRGRGINIPAIALSGFGQEQDMKQSREAGFAAHLVKPVSLPKLEDAIARAVSSR